MARREQNKQRKLQYLATAAKLSPRDAGAWQALALAYQAAGKIPEAADAWILEVNDAPGIDIHHYPYRGTPQPVAYGLVKSMFPSVKLPSGVLPRY